MDDHLPYSFLNLGRARLTLKDYPGAQQSMQEASALAPLDLHLLTALTYAQFLNYDYLAAIATAAQVHGRKHETAAIVHYFAAAALQGQNNLPEAQNELQTFLEENPKSPAAHERTDNCCKIAVALNDQQSKRVIDSMTMSAPWTRVNFGGAETNQKGANGSQVGSSGSSCALHILG